MRHLLSLALAAFVMHSEGFCSDYIDIATCIEARTQQYPMNGYEQIVVFAPYRTGTTYVYNIMRFLFESEEMKYAPRGEDIQSELNVCKTHLPQMPKPGTAIICTIRNPLDACFSLYRVLSSTQAVCEADIEKIVEGHMGVWVLSLPFLLNNRKCILLRYEEFVNRIEVVFEKIEAFFSIAIAEQDKELLEKALSRENVLANIKDQASFDYEAPYTRFHGNHIDLREMPAEERDRVRSKILHELKKYQPLIALCGYASVFDSNAGKQVQ